MNNQYIVKGLDSDPINECLDCQHEGKDWAEKDEDHEDEATVFCPNCGSIHFYIKD
jgi:Zn finger protein HypA/HybF involved in hydrogenase expression